MSLSNLTNNPGFSMQVGNIVSSSLQTNNTTTAQLTSTTCIVNPIANQNYTLPLERPAAAGQFTLQCNNTGVCTWVAV